MPKMPNYRAV